MRRVLRRPRHAPVIDGILWAWWPLTYGISYARWVWKNGAPPMTMFRLPAPDVAGLHVKRDQEA